MEKTTFSIFFPVFPCLVIPSVCPFVIPSLPLSCQDFVLSSSPFLFFGFSKLQSFGLCCLYVSADFSSQFKPSLKSGFCLSFFFLSLRFLAALRGYILKDENRMGLSEGETWNLGAYCFSLTLISLQRSLIVQYQSGMFKHLCYVL